MKKTKKEIINYFNSSNAKLRSSSINNQQQVRHFRIRIKKVRDSLDYLLRHPWSNDNSFSTIRHSRDTIRLSQSKFGKSEKKIPKE